MMVLRPACSLADSIESRALVKFKVDRNFARENDRQIRDYATFARRQNDPDSPLRTRSLQMTAERNRDAEKLSAR